MKPSKKQLQRNIFLVYILTALDYAWFWIAIWVLFYLRFTDYAGIGLLEAIMITTSVFAEVPTGAIADLLGKKKTMLVAFAVGSVGNILMGLAGDFTLLALGVLVATLGGALTSGTVEALVYDSLLSIKKEKTYEKVLGNMSSIRMATLGFVALIGGFLYSLNPGLPFIGVGLAKLVAIGVGLLLVEPPIDSETFSWSVYKNQTVQGFKQFFAVGYRKQHIAVLLLTALVVMNGHVFIDAQLVDLGWNEKQLGVIATVMYGISALVGQLAPWISKKFGTVTAHLFSALYIAGTMLVVPLLGPVVATVFIISRNNTIEIFGNTASMIVNAHTESKYRATTLSTYSMLSNIPYIFAAYGLGSLMDRWSSQTVVATLGALLAAVVVAALFVVPRQSKSSI